MVQFKTKEAKEYFVRTRDSFLADRLDNAMINARFNLNLGVKAATTREQYEDARIYYFRNMEILKEYGIFAV